MVTVLSVGGSIVAPDQPDVEFLTRFSKMIREWLSKDSSRKLILVIGGGGPARIYQYVRVADPCLRQHESAHKAEHFHPFHRVQYLHSHQIHPAHLP